MRRILVPVPRPLPRGILSPVLPALILSLLAITACGSGGDIQPGIGAAGVRIGDNRTTVEKTLGKPEHESTTGVQSAKGRKEMTYLLYTSRGLDVLLEGGTVRSIFLYHEGADDHRQYQGKMAGGITLGSTREEVLKALGEPSSRGIGQDSDRWLRYDTGVEASFSAEGTLHHLVISQPH